jgi:hypothetical protein
MADRTGRSGEQAKGELANSPTANPLRRRLNLADDFLNERPTITTTVIRADKSLPVVLEPHKVRIPFKLWHRLQPPTFAMPENDDRPMPQTPAFPIWQDDDRLLLHSIPNKVKAIVLRRQTKAIMAVPVATTNVREELDGQDVLG